MTTKLILEMGCNHNGDIKNAYAMIDEAAALGVWAVKFQKRDINSMPSNILNTPRDKKNSFGDTYGEHREYLEFSPKEMKSLKLYAEKRGLVFMVSVFDEKSFDDMREIGVKHIKTPSQLFSNSRMNDYLNSNKGACTLYGSTGMHTIQEVINQNHVYDIVFYCRSIYPCKPNDVNLETMVYYKKQFNGYSSHDKNGIAIPYTIVAGAEYVERHYTLDKTMKGSDHSTVSSDFNEIKQIIRNIEFVEGLMGKVLTRLPQAEIQALETYRSYY